uniref:Cyclin-dependent kinase inhibitor domain-containing protein n=1 Tax=Ananas comosus var. bracteatus TaxID=296719 RepID=A0A6V7Q4W2_ANACO|nr:unnamed protein product [Ananas comosus var. bracteatus]
MVGVRTRAKTLAMAAAAAAAEEKARSKRRRRKKKKKNPSEATVELRISYLQLRSRRVVMKSPLRRRRRNETTISNIRIDESTTRSAVEMVPSETEIEEFFVVAERAERSRFADKYNYDIINDAPLEGAMNGGSSNRLNH